MNKIIVKEGRNIRESLEDFYTKPEVDERIPTKLSDLGNDVGFLTEHQDISGKVDKEVGKGLSTNDYSNADKTIVSKIITEGTGDKYLSDDGSYKEVSGGGVTISEVNTEIDKRIVSSISTPSSVGNAVKSVSIGGKAHSNDSVAIGENSESSFASHSVAIGSNSRARNTNAIAIGGYARALGNRSIAIGGGVGQAGSPVANSNDSISIGYDSSATGLNAAAIGRGAVSNGDSAWSVGAGASSVKNSTAIGANSSANFENCVALGRFSSTTATNQVQLGDSQTTTYAYGAVQDRSDARDKAHVRDIELGLDFINKLRPVEYKWDYREDYFRDIEPQREDFEDEESYIQALEQARVDFFKNPIKDGSKTRVRYHTGLIAQEVKQVMDDLDVDFGGFQHHQMKGGLDVMSLGYNELIPVLVKAVQTLTQKVEDLEGKLEEK